MIWFFNLEKASAGACDDYNDLFQYIIAMEKPKLSNNHDCSKKACWSFVFFPPVCVSSLYKKEEKGFSEPLIKEAYENKFGFVKMAKGTEAESAEVLVRSQVELENFKKQWCLEYCHAHRYVVMENPSSPSNTCSVEQRFSAAFA